MTDSAANVAEPVSSTDLPGSDRIPAREAWLVALLLVALAFACNALSLLGPRIWGDDAFGPGNRLLLNSTGFSTLWTQPLVERLDRYPLPEYAPLTQATFYVERLIFGNAAMPSRIVNALLHGACGLMAWLLLRRLGAPLAWLAAAIFVAHPLQVQNVSWAAQRPIILASALGLAATYLLLRSCGAIAVPKREVETEATPLPDSPGRLYGMGLLLFTLANLADARAGVIALLVIFLAWWRLGTHLSKLPARIILWPSLIGLGFTLLAVRLQISQGGATWRFADSALGDLAVRLQLAGLSAWHYFVKALVPFPLRVDDVQWNVSPTTFVGYFAFAAVIAAIAGTWTWRKHGARIPFLAVSSFVILLLPALNFVNLNSQRYSYVADRYAYLAVLPVAGLIAWAAFAFARRSAAIVGAVLLVVLVGLSIERSRAYASTDAFIAAAEAGRADSYLAASIRADVALKAKDYVAMRSAGERMAALSARADAPAPIRNAPDGAWTVAEADRLRGNIEGAVKQFEALALAHPEYGPTWRSLGLAWSTVGDPNRTRISLEKAIVLGPRDGYARTAYAALLADRYARGTSDPDERAKLREKSQLLFLDATECDPNNPDHHVAYSLALQAFGLNREANAELVAASMLDDSRADVAANFAEQFIGIEQFAEADTWADKALERDPSLPAAHLAKARVLAAQTKRDEAIASLEKSLEKLPDNAALQLELLNQLYLKGDFARAEPIVLELLARSPYSADLWGRLVDIREKRNDRDGRADALQQLVNLTPDNARAVFELAKSRRDQGRLDEAITLADRFTRLRPDVPEGKAFLDDLRKQRGTTTVPTTAPTTQR
jgi:tetratricopeptide (TPR) repeat protein